MSEIKTVCVCGAGTMGSGIAQVAAQSGFKTIQFDLNETMLSKSRATIEKNLQVQVDKHKLTDAEKNEISARILYTTSINDCKADIIIEAIVEIAAIKVDLFKQLASINDAACIYATNTSSLSVNEIAVQLPYPQQFVGMHFFNPAPLMKLVEVVAGSAATEHVIEQVIALAKNMGKVPVLCKDAPGFIVNHVARPYYLEAMRLVESGLAQMEDVDRVMENAGFKMGPFRLMDLIGIDINYNVSSIVWTALDQPERLKPSLLQKAKLDAGKLGRKTGEGFYQYEK